MHRIGQPIRRFALEEQGGIGILSIFWFTLLLGISGVAVDAANGYRYKAVLQATADAAVLAAVMDLPDTDAASATALEYVRANMPPDHNGVVLAQQDVLTGVWNAETRTIEPAEAWETADAIRATVRRSAANGNPVFVSLLQLVGFASWDIAASATAMRFYPGCLSREGLISAKRVVMSTDTHFINDFCIYGAQGVSVTNGNSFEEGVKVTMEDLADFEMPTGGFESNPGLEEALGTDFYDLVILDLIEAIVEELKNPKSQYQPGYIDPDQPAEVEHRKANDISSHGLAPNRVHHLPCNAGSNALNLPGDMLYSNVVIVTDCRISIGSKARFENVTMATSWSDPSSAAVSASSQVSWGADDNCVSGGGAKVLAPGAIKVSAQNYYYGAQFISRSTVSVAANAEGGSGVSVISGEEISLTSSHGFMGLCEGANVETDKYQVTYFRLVA